MTALSKNTPRTRVGQGLLFIDPIAAATTIYNGSLVALDTSGDAVPATPTGTVMRGVATEGVDNSDGAAGDASVPIERGPFLVANDGSLDRTHIGTDVFVVDDGTVGAAGTLAAGKCLDVIASGVVVEIL